VERERPHDRWTAIHALSVTFPIACEILRPLIPGFALSGVVQAVVPHNEMSCLLPGHRPRSIVTALALGAASSCCSYSAVALARSPFRKGVHFTAAMAFEPASTNFAAEATTIILTPLGIAAPEHGNCQRWVCGPPGVGAIIKQTQQSRPSPYSARELDVVSCWSHVGLCPPMTKRPILTTAGGDPLERRAFLLRSPSPVRLARPAGASQIVSKQTFVLQHGDIKFGLNVHDGAGPRPRHGVLPSALMDRTIWRYPAAGPLAM
jgi:hypothetical protein